LMTAHGSEVVAAQALANGAASFVPKTELAENLLETVMHVLVMSETDSRYKKLISCATKTDFEFKLENDPALIDPLIEMIQQIAIGQGSLSHNDRVQMGVALESALLNSMVRGNLELTRQQMPVNNRHKIAELNAQEPFKDRKVYFRSLITPDSAQFTIRDEGSGFDISTVPDASDPESFKDGSGRGLVLIQAFMDEVVFNSTGNELQLVKNRSHEPA
jgi:hypothetical protein